jgi:hypothetical protein
MINKQPQINDKVEWFAIFRGMTTHYQGIVENYVEKQTSMGCRMYAIVKTHPTGRIIQVQAARIRKLEDTNETTIKANSYPFGRQKFRV